MAYDYNGFWSGGTTTGFLSNLTNMDTLDVCYKNPDTNCNRKGCEDCMRKGCLNCGTWGTTIQCYGSTTYPPYKCNPNFPDCAPDTQIPSGGCTSNLKMTFTKSSSNILTPKTSPPNAECPLIMYNVLGDSDETPNLKSDLVTKLRTEWINDDSTYQVSPGHITLSVKTILNFLSNEKYLGIDRSKIVIGLPYYGRTFQTNTSDDSGYRRFQKGTYGVYQRYEYGTSYSFSDIYEQHYVNYKSANVYTIPLTKDQTEYTEDIVYIDGTNKNRMLTHITDKMNEEMISYNSAASIKAKVKYAKEKGFGGYMCWHMLSDYYPDA